MSWGVNVKAEFNLPRVKIDVLETILENTEMEIEYYKQQLLVLCASDNLDYDKETYEDRNDYVLRKFDEIMEELQEEIKELQLLELALDEESEKEEY